MCEDCFGVPYEKKKLAHAAPLWHTNLEETQMKKLKPVLVVSTQADVAFGQSLAYAAGLVDGKMAGVMPGAAAVQQRAGYSDEETICYLNGVGDGIAGVAA